MQKKMKIILALVFASVLLVVSLLLVYTITIIQTPVTTIDVDLIELTSDEAVIKARVDVVNPNLFDIVMNNFEMETTTPNGNTVSTVSLDGSSISSQSNTTFSTIATISFDGSIPEVLETKISSEVSVFFGFIYKTFPFTATLRFSIESIIDDVVSPDITIQVEFGDITLEHIEITGAIDVYNPNTLGGSIEDISIIVYNENNENVGSFALSGSQIPAGEHTKIDMSGSVLLKALNAEQLIFTINGQAGIQIAGGKKNFSLFKEIDIQIPNLEDILSLDIATEAVLTSDIRLSLRGVINDLTLEIINPNKIPLIVNDIVFYVYRVDASGETLLDECALGEGNIEPEDTLVLTSQIITPYKKLIFSGKGIFPDELLITMQAKVSVPGVDQYMLIGVRGNQDLRIFR
jgi:LEA14-like dessication related protein